MKTALNRRPAPALSADGAPPEVTCYLDSGTNLYYAANFLSGLFELAQEGAIRLFLETPSDGLHSYSGASLVLLLLVKTPMHASRIAVDLFDRSDLFATQALRACDLYFKRSYYSPDVAVLPPQLRVKIAPWGLNYPCRSLACASRVLTALAGDYAKRVLRTLPDIKPWLQSIAIRPFLKCSPVRAFEQPAAKALEPLVLFQPRLWEPQEVGPGDSAAAVNAERVAVVRALRKRFPKKYAGGLQPTAFAVKHYPDLVSRHPQARGSYLHWSRRCVIAVQTRGLHHSQPFKLAESIAASQCIVSSPVRNELPESLIDGQHYLAFGNPDQCADRCEELLANPPLAQTLRAETEAYYRSQVHPAVRAAKVIERSLDPAGASGEEGCYA